MSRFTRICKELIHHLPYSAVGVGAALGLLLAFERTGFRVGSPEFFFHTMHPIHILISAAVATAMLWKYDRHFLKAVCIAFFSSLPICTISDIIIPYLGGRFLHTPVIFHLCIVEEPWLVLPACFLGIVLGMIFLKWVERLTEIGHLSHVLVSSLASMLYLISFDITLWSTSISIVFAIALVAVWLPCCLSDIIFPLIFAKGQHPHAPCCGHHPHDM